MCRHPHCIVLAESSWSLCFLRYADVYTYDSGRCYTLLPFITYFCYHFTFPGFTFILILWKSKLFQNNQECSRYSKQKTELNRDPRFRKISGKSSINMIGTDFMCKTEMTVRRLINYCYLNMSWMLESGRLYSFKNVHWNLLVINDHKGAVLTLNILIKVVFLIVFYA